MNKLFLLYLMLLPNFLIAQVTDFDELLKNYNDNSNFNGVVLVATDGKIDYLNSIGMANREIGTPLNTKTKFKIASITKTFTAVLILQLVEQGKLELDIPFGKYFSNYKGEAKDSVTIEHLLTYSSGISDESEKLEMEPYQTPTDLDEFIDNYCSGRLVATPGTVSSYSNIDYIILQKIIENVTGKTFESVLKESILTPLGMENTGLLSSRDKFEDLTKSYTLNDSTGELILDEEYLIENFFGAGAMYSTVEDLLKFDTGIFDHRLLSEETTELMIKPKPELNGVAFGVWYASGYGTFSKPFIYRTGGILGSTSNWIHTIEDKKTIIVFNNTNATNLYEFSEKLYLVNSGQDVKISLEPKLK